MRYILVFILFVAVRVDAQHSLLMNRPLEFNGGFAGNTGFDRFSLNSYAMNYNKTDDVQYQARHNNNISYDVLSNKLKGGIGVSVGFYNTNRSYVYLDSTVRYDSLDNGHISSIEKYYYSNNFRSSGYHAEVTYAPKFIVKQKYGLSPFISIGYRHLIHNTALLTRMDNGSTREWTHGVYSDIGWAYSYNPSPKDYLYTNIGFLINKQNWFFGYKMLGLQTNMESVIHSFQFGKLFVFPKNENYGFGLILENRYGLESALNPGSDIAGFSFDFSHGIIYLKAYQFTIGTDLGTRYFVNFKNNNWSLGYSINATEGYKLHEIGFQYTLKKKEEKDKLLSVPLKN